MKRVISFLFCLSLLCGCGSASGNTQSSEPSFSADAGAVSEPLPEAPETSGNETVSSEDPRAHMEAYECMEIAFLGVADNDHTISDVIKRASKFAGFSWLTSVDEADICRGETGEVQNVFVILPAENTDLRIGAYSWYAGEITSTYFEQEKAGPVIFAETTDSVKPLSQIEYCRHLPDGVIEDRMYTGFNLISSKLRTDYHMGIVDTTVYDEFTSAEVPVYSQFLFDTLNSYEDIQAQLKEGGQLHPMDELFYEDEMYAVYDLERSDGSHCGYAVTPSPSAPSQVMYAEDYQNWHPLGKE